MPQILADDTVQVPCYLLKVSRCCLYKLRPYSHSSRNCCVRLAGELVGFLSEGCVRAAGSYTPEQNVSGILSGVEFTSYRY